MRRNAVLVIAGLVAVVVALWLLAAPEPPATNSTTTTAETEQPKKKKKTKKKREVQQPRVLFGEVVDKDGGPVVGASVVVKGRDVVVTNADGLFTLDELAAGADVDFEAVGFLAVHVAGGDLPRENEAFWSQVLVRESDGLRVRVVVDNDAQDPIAGAEIVAAEARAVGVTNAAGVAVVVVADSVDELLIGHGLHGVVAVPVDASTRELLVKLPPPAILEGVVVDKSGQPIGNGVIKVRGRIENAEPFRDRRVSLLWRLQRKHGQVVVGDDGSFRAEVVSGHSTLTSQFAGYRPGDGVEVDAAPGLTTHVRIVLETSPRIEGVVVDVASGAPIARATLHLDGNRYPDAVTDDDGHFVLDSLKQQASSVAVKKKGYRSLTLGGLDGAASRSDPLRIELQQGEGGADVVGIGVVVDGVTGGLVVREVDDNGPAKAKGIVVGDVIVAVDGARLGDARDDNTARVRGQPGTTVRLDIQRDGKAPFTLEIERARIPIAARGGTLAPHAP